MYTQKILNFLPPNTRPFVYTPLFKPEWKDKLFVLNTEFLEAGKLVSMSTESSAHVFIVTKTYNSEQSFNEFSQRVAEMDDYLKAVADYNLSNSIITTVEIS